MHRGAPGAGSFVSGQTSRTVCRPLYPDGQFARPVSGGVFRPYRTRRGTKSNGSTSGGDRGSICEMADLLEDLSLDYGEELFFDDETALRIHDLLEGAGMEYRKPYAALMQTDGCILKLTGQPGDREAPSKGTPSLFPKEAWRAALIHPAWKRSAGNSISHAAKKRLLPCALSQPAHLRRICLVRGYV